MENKFIDVLNKIINERMKVVLRGLPLNRATCMMIYELIFNSLTEVLTELKDTHAIVLSNDAVNYIAQAIYDSTYINGTEELDPNVFTKRATVADISTRELTVVATLFAGTDLAAEPILEVRRRS